MKESQLDLQSLTLSTAVTMHSKYTILAILLYSKKKKRKCGIFGMCAEEVTYVQLNLLIDEAQFCGKGADSVVSMVHHYLQHFALGEGKVCLQADNCVAQNKNIITVSYRACRVMVGLNQSCELNFMLVGHIHFSPDRFFGLIQRKDCPQCPPT